MSNWRGAFGVVIAILLAQSVLPCGPNFPRGYVWDGSGEAMLDWPRTSFTMELSRYIALDIPDEDTLVANWERDILPKDIRDLERVLFDSGEDALFVWDASAEYERLRRNYYRPPGPQSETPATILTTPLMDTCLPAEFALYAEGARLYHGRDYVGATARWDALLALPPEERCRRSVWAAYMLGRTWLKRDAEVAPRYFEMTIRLALEGYDDILGLSTASFEELGRIEWMNENYAPAISHYMAYMRQCDAKDRRKASKALYRVCGSMFSDDDLDLSTVQDATTLNMMAMWVNSGRRGWDEQRWLDALKKIAPSSDIHGAERIACAAYYAGDIAAAEAWLKYADKKDPHGQWLRAKLLARAGKMKESEALLASLTNAFPANYSWKDYSGYGETVVPNRLVQGDLGVCRLNIGSYAGALEAFAGGGFDEDAAYVADRVLTTNELKNFVERASDEPWMQALSDIRYGRDDLSQGQRLEYLLGRRLVRQGRIQEAVSYLPDILDGSVGYWYDNNETDQSDLKSVARELSEDLKAANNRDRSLEARAQSLMEAAWITRKSGLLLYGTAHAPDMEIYGGMFEFSLAPRTNSKWASDDERRRVAASAPVPDRRHHYRWRAADLLWQAARLFPDNDERTARALWEGGRLIANRDPGGADKFYKALVNRCRKLPIGQEADRLRWFPPRPTAWEDPAWAGTLALE